MNQLSRIPMPARVVIVLVAALLLSLLLMRQSSSDLRATAATNPPITGQCTGAAGVIKGDVTIKGREGTYAISALSDGLKTPIDTASGQVSGRRQHQPLVFTTVLGRATPLLIRAQVNNENLSSCTFNFWRASATGVEQNYFRIKLTNAHLVSYQLSGRPGAGSTTTFSLVYQKIEWTYLIGGLTASDDWAAPLG
ncbi:MAG TPA: type VI secretion system tube protein TssD [Nocardioides sp.]|nr:type VI secretion system tube protein TssD [Nocardioides sp.]